MLAGNFSRIPFCSRPLLHTLRSIKQRSLAYSMAPRPDGRDLLGLDSPLNSTADNTFISFGGKGRPRFPNAIQDWSATPRILRERSMIAFMGSITDKADWTRKVHDDEIVQKWRAEAAELEQTQPPERALSQKMFEYCIQELRDYAKASDASDFVPAIDADAAVYKSDSIISDQLKNELKQAASVLEDVPDKHKDWHPGSDELVLDLVHPSLFPLLYGRSRVLLEGQVALDECDKQIGKGEVMPVPDPEHLTVEKFPGLAGYHQSRHNNGQQHFYSARFQWLPCEVRFSDDDAVQITSYVNDLHPKEHKPLYKVLERVIAQVIPMWDATLASTERTDILNPDVRISYGAADYESPPTRSEAGAEAEPVVQEILAEWRDDGRTTATAADQLDEDELYELDDEWEKKQRVLVMPEPESYSEHTPYTHPLLNEGDIPVPNGMEKPPTKIGLRDIFADQGLQIIVKLANIHLTPGKPRYEGGSWHVEGQLNEHICASALYYYDSSNITDNHLSFREVTRVDHFDYTAYEQDDYEHLERMYEIEQDGPAQQYLGKVNTREGRLLTFPNVLHHRVESFQLADPSQPGHRKILALFLVDPYCRIPSTANVPPQQKEWWRAMVQSLDRVGKLPAELAEHVVDSAGDFPIDLEEAKRIRLELMEERKVFVEDIESRVQIESFSFCEH